MKEFKQLPCGCKLEIRGRTPEGKPRYYLDLDKLPDCPAVWDMLATGRTKGVFQLERASGQKWCKELKPINKENLSALAAVIRPGCLSGDSNISVSFLEKDGSRLYSKKVKLRDLHQQFIRSHNAYEKGIVSLDEKTNLLFTNKIEDIFYTGQKEVFKVLIHQFSRKEPSDNKPLYNLECTSDHRILTHNRGWQALENLEIGERIAVVRRRTVLRPNKCIEGEKSFRDICLAYYEKKCLFCDWNGGSLDVNHLDGNRKTNNAPENLCFLCPNHHRMYSEGKISKEEVIAARPQHELKRTKHIDWRIYLGKKSLGIKDTYDIQVEGPNHNFVGGNIVVHNCTKALDENDISMTQHFCRRKNGEEEIDVYHPAIKEILEPTYQVMVYQEQSIAIAVRIAGFTPEEADSLRKAIGKKLAAEMSKLKEKFIEGCVKVGLVNREQAEFIFGWIEKSQRYSFNKAHSYHYGVYGYKTAYLKVHAPRSFYKAWLKYAKDITEIDEMMEDAKIFNVEIRTPDIRHLESHFYIKNDAVYFGLANIKDVGDAQVQFLREADRAWLKKDWLYFLLFVADEVSSTAMNRWIETGAMKMFDLPRQQMLYEYNHIWKGLGTSKIKKEFLRNKYLAGEADTLAGLIGLLASGTRKSGGGCHTADEIPKFKALQSSLLNPPSKLVDTPDWIVWCEETYLGGAITCTKLDSYTEMKSTCTCKEFLDGYKGYTVIAAELKRCNEIEIKRGDNAGDMMAFLSLSDGTCTLDGCVMFTGELDRYRDILVVGQILMFIGERTKKGSLRILQVQPMSDD